jgi:glycosyltransferase involved in cell wall biosynthesis
MPKILLVANTDWYLYNFRLSLARFLRAQGFSVTLVSPPGKYVEPLKKEGFHYVNWNIGRQSIAPWSELPALLALAKIYRHEQADLVHHHTIKPVLYGSLAARLAGRCSVVNSITGRGYVFLSKDTRASILKGIARFLYRLALSHPNQATIFENETDRQYFIDQNLIPAQHTFLIAGVGVDTDRFTPAPEPPGTPVILLSSRMLVDKGVGTLVEAARQLHPAFRVRVVLVGEPDPGNPSSIPEEQLHAWAAEGLVEWWGWRSDMNAVYQQAHIVTLPTMYGEGVPTVLLEAAACGRPIVTTDMPGCRDIAIDQVNGLLVPPDNPTALASALGKLLADPDLRGRMGAASRRLVQQKFTVQLVNQATLAVYQDLLSRLQSAQS